MDFELFSTATDQAVNTTQRSAKAERAYRLGCEYAQRATQSPSTPLASTLFQNALKCFAFAITMNRSDAAPYVQAAAIFIRYRQQPLALKYLQEARRLDPEHPEVASLLKYCQGNAPAQTLCAQMQHLTRELLQHTETWQTQAGGQDLAFYEQVLSNAFDACEAFLNTLESQEALGQSMQAEFDAYDVLSEAFENLDALVAAHES